MTTTQAPEGTSTAVHEHACGHGCVCSGPIDQDCPACEVKLGIRKPSEVEERFADAGTR